MPVETKYFGKKLTILRNLFAFIFSFIVAFIIGKVVTGIWKNYLKDIDFLLEQLF